MSKNNFKHIIKILVRQCEVKKENSEGLFSGEEKLSDNISCPINQFQCEDSNKTPIQRFDLSRVNFDPSNKQSDFLKKF